MPPIPRRRRTVPGRRRGRHPPSPVGRRRRPGAPIAARRGRWGWAEAGVKGRGRGRTPVTPRQRRGSRAKAWTARSGTERRRGGTPITARRGRRVMEARTASERRRRPAVESRPRARAGRARQRQDRQRRQRQTSIFSAGEFHVNTSFKGFTLRSVYEKAEFTQKRR